MPLNHRSAIIPSADNSAPGHAPEEPDRHYPRSADIGYAQLDLDRARRTGDPEVVFGAGKTASQVVGALQALHQAHPERQVMATRLSDDALAACAALPGVIADRVGKLAVLGPQPSPHGTVAVVAAGTSDLPIVHECARTVQVFGARADLIIDVGVAGLHRLLAQRDRIAAADAVIAVAGMEAALPTVLGGLVGVPIIAVPTSVGYGWHLDGLVAMLGMLNSCAAGVVTVNVDNGFGAGVAAARIARNSARQPTPGDLTCANCGSTPATALPETCS
jgi:pyridinium-3,5-biscarboxylic acid mononucleotide synthase